MTQISRYPLQKQVEERVYEVLMESVAAANNSVSVNCLLEDLLSPTERLMIAKRISIALLLIKKYDQRTISKWLKVSLATVSKVSLVLQKGKGGYQTIIGSLLNKEELNKFIQRIDDAIADFLPPMSRNWRHWRKARWESKISNQKPF
jgi:uncharacterized protein YerC